MKIIRDILTDYDGTTYDTGRVIAVALVLSMIGFEGYSVYHTKLFDPQAFGMGMGAVLAALGCAIFGDNHKRP